MSRELNLTPELARLLDFTARVSTSICQRSQNTDNDLYRNRLHENAIWQLADTLHNFDLLSHAILANNPKAMLRVCDLLLHDYRSHVDDCRKSFGGAEAVKNLQNEIHLADFLEGIDILSIIQAKVRPLLQTKCPA